MKVYFLAGFPESIEPYFRSSIMQKAQERWALSVEFLNLYTFARKDTGGRIDDRPFGGGAGTILRAEPIAQAMEYVLAREKHIFPVYLGPRGQTLTQVRLEKIHKQRKNAALVILCGHYEGVDERVLEAFGFHIYSLGNFVISSGELAACVFVDALVRLIPGAIKNKESFEEESFSRSFGRKKEYPHFTRPAEWRWKKIPDILASGNHKKIDQWRKNNLL